VSRWKAEKEGVEEKRVGSEVKKAFDRNPNKTVC